MTLEEIRAYLEADCCTLSPAKYKDVILDLLLSISGGVGGTDTGEPTPHTLATGTTSPVSAGAYSVTIQVSAGPSVVNGITIPTNGSLTLTANNGQVLPAITITGGNYSWGAII